MCDSGIGQLAIGPLETKEKAMAEISWFRFTCKSIGRSMLLNVIIKYQYLAANKSTYLAIKLNYQFRFYSIPIPFFSSPIPPKNLSVPIPELNRSIPAKGNEPISGIPGLPVVLKTGNARIPHT